MQLLHPYFDTDRSVSRNAYGYNATDIQVDIYDGPAYYFGGLVRDPFKYALLDGQPQHENWCFAIGMFCARAGQWYTKGIPGFCEGESRVRLFARVNNYELPRDIVCSQNICHYSQILGMLLSSFYIFISA